MDVHDSGIDQKQDTDEKSRKIFHLCEESHEVAQETVGIGGQEHDQIVGIGGQEHDHEHMCIGEVTAADMMHKQLCGDSGSCRYGGKMGKGNGSQPLSDEEED